MIISKRYKTVIVAAVLACSAALPRLSIASAIIKTDPSNITVCEERIGQQPYQVSRVLIKAKPEQVWQILTDYSGATNIFPAVKRCEVLVDKGATKVIHFQVHPSGLLASFEYNLELHEQLNRLIEWHRVSGDFKVVDGFWRLEPVECGRSTLVTYGTYVNGGIFIPQAFIKRQSHIDLPQVMAALKYQAETTMRIASHGMNRPN